MDAIIAQTIDLVVLFQIVNGLLEDAQFIAVQTFLILIFHTIEHGLEYLFVGERELDMLMDSQKGSQHHRPVMKNAFVDTEI